MTPTPQGAAWLTGRGVHELFDERARRSPDAVAVECRDKALSYRELAARSSALARRLRRHGLRTDEPVGVCADRSPGLIVAMLAAFKAGVAYLPLDPAYPRSRLDAMLHGARARLVLTDQKGAASLRDCRVERIALASATDGETEQAPGDGLPPVAPDALAYVIYTSGSTGGPKGVAVPHRGLANVASAQEVVFGLGPGDRVLQFSSPCFDASIFEVVLALGAGASLCLADVDDLLPGEPLAATLRQRRIGVIVIPPTCLRAVPHGPLPDLHTIAVAGEACPASLVDTWAAGRRFLNLYGPTEATIWTTSARCHQGQGQPTIGGPIANVTTYVLDPWMEPVKPGVPGELYIGGPGVARGYLRAPALSAARFVPDPFAGDGGRLYRTGDLARWRQDGSALEFIGRVDEQVKVRGLRIEPGEVQSALDAHPSVADSVVTAGAGEAADRLVAYLVASDAPVAGDEMRRFLGERLPAHMIPSAFVWLARLPIGPTGKLDRPALPDPWPGTGPASTGPASTGPASTASSSDGPAGSVPQLIAGVFAEVLGAVDVDAEDDFFDLGGYSIKAVAVASRIATTLGVDLSAREVFVDRTPAKLADRVAALRTRTHEEAKNS